MVPGIGKAEPFPGRTAIAKPKVPRYPPQGLQSVLKVARSKSCSKSMKATRKKRPHRQTDFPRNQGVGYWGPTRRWHFRAGRDAGIKKNRRPVTAPISI